MHVRTLVDLHNTRLAIENLRRVSDRLVGLGPFGIGLDGLLGAIPGLGEFFGAIYSVGAGVLLFYHGWRGRASAGVLFQVGILIAARTLSNFIPIAGRGNARSQSPDPSALDARSLARSAWSAARVSKSSATTRQQASSHMRCCDEEGA